jgi:hypothetical protein
MATKSANVKGIKFMEEPVGADKGGVAMVTYDLTGGTVYTGGADTLQLGGGGFENGVATIATLATMIQNRRRDGKTITVYAAAPGPVPGLQPAATNGPTLYAQTVASSAGNVTLNLFSAPTSGSAITTTAASWDRAASVVVYYTAT